MAEVKHLKINNISYDIKTDGDNIDLSIIAESFTTSASYSTNEYTVYEGNLYRFTDNHTAGTWTTTDVAKVNITNEIINRKNVIQTEYDSETNTIEFIDAEAISGGGSSDPTSWGNITGTLSNQTDLQDALDAKANVSDLPESILYYPEQTVSVTTNAQIMRIPANDMSDDITTDSIVLECIFANPAYITTDVSWQSYDGYITFTGTCITATTANVVLGKKSN